METERKIAIRLISLEKRHIVPIYIYIYTPRGIPLSRGDKIGRGEEREDEEKIRGGGGDRGRLAS